MLHSRKIFDQIIWLHHTFNETHEASGTFRQMCTTQQSMLTSQTCNFQLTCLTLAVLSITFSSFFSENKQLMLVTEQKTVCGNVLHSYVALISIFVRFAAKQHESAYRSMYRPVAPGHNARHASSHMPRHASSHVTKRLIFDCATIWVEPCSQHFAIRLCIVYLSL